MYAGSVLVCIIIPRLILAAVAGLSKWRLQRSLPLPMRSAYFATLRALRGGNVVDVLVIPFRYEMTDQVKSDLTRLLERIHGLAVTIAVQPPVLMGEDPADWKAALGNERHIAVFVIFNLAATAEADAHGELLKRVLGDVRGRIPVIPIVDTGAYADRQQDRFNERCNQWRTVLDQVRCRPLFLNLKTPDAEGILENLEARLHEYE